MQRRPTAAAVACARNAARRRKPSRRLLAASATLAILVLIANPIGHLDNSRTGWLASAAVAQDPPAQPA